MIPKTLLNFKNKKADTNQSKIGLDQPGLTENPIKSITGGTSAQLFSGQKHNAKNQAKTGLDNGTQVTKKHGILGSTVSLNEASLKIDSLLEELSRTPSASASGTNTAKGVPPVDHQRYLNNQTKSISRMIDTVSDNRSDRMKAAANVKPDMTAGEQTLGIKGPIADKNANARYQSSDNNARTQDRLDAQYQQSQQG